MWWEVAPRGVTEGEGAIEARVARVFGFRVIRAAEPGEPVVVGADRRVGPRHMIDEAELTTPGRSTLAGHQGKRAGALLRRSGLGRFGAIREKRSNAGARCVLRRSVLVPKPLSSWWVVSAWVMVRRSQGLRRASLFFSAMALARSS